MLTILISNLIWNELVYSSNIVYIYITLKIYPDPEIKDPGHLYTSLLTFQMTAKYIVNTLYMINTI